MKKKAAKLTAILLILIFAISVFIGAAPPIQTSESVSASAQTLNADSAYEMPDYLNARYPGLGSSHVYQVITVEYLWHLLRTPIGTSLIVFADPELESSQEAIPAINTAAKAKGVTRIYYFDTYIAGAEYDDNANIWPDFAYDYWLWEQDSGTTYTQSVQFQSYATGGTPANITPAVTPTFIYLGEIIKAWMGSNIDATYNAKEDTYLFAFERTDAGVENGSISADVLLKDGQTADQTFDSAVDAVLAETMNGETFNGIVWSDFDFAQTITLHIGQTTMWGGNVSTTGIKGGIPESYRNGFKLKFVPYYVIRYMMEEAAGEHNILFSGTWCGDSQQAIPLAIENAHKYDANPVFVFDFRLGGGMSLSGVESIVTNTFTNPNGGTVALDNRYTSVIEAEGFRGDLTNVKVDGVVQATDNLGDGTSTSRYQITRVGHLGMAIMNMLGGGEYKAPLVGESPNTRFQFFENGEVTAAHEVLRTSYKKYLSPYLFAWDKDNTERKLPDDPQNRGSSQVTKVWIHKVEDWEIKHGSNANNNTAAGAVGPFYDYELQTGTLTNMQKAIGRLEIALFFGAAEFTYTPPMTANIQNTFDGAGGCGGDLDSPKDNPNGAGQSLIPNQGTKDYDVLDQYNAQDEKYGYDITVDFNGDFNSPTAFTCTTTITATALKSLTQLSFDFREITISSVDVTLPDGTLTDVAYVQNNESSIDLQKLTITAAGLGNKTIAAGQEFAVTVNYTLCTVDYAVANGYNVEKYQGFTMHMDGKGATAIGEPVGSIYWFPCNNTPGDGATYKITLRSPNTGTLYTMVGPGVRGANNSTSGAPSGRRQTVWTVKQPTSTYQVFGTFSSNLVEVHAVNAYTNNSATSPNFVTADGRNIPYYAYVNKDIYLDNSISGGRNRDATDSFYGKLPYYIRTLENLFGAYPGEALGFVFEDVGDGGIDGASASAGWGAIETKDRPFFTYSGTVTGENTFIHEYVHMWFGDAVLMDSWDELWLTEGFTTYGIDLFYEETSTTGWTVYSKWEQQYNSMDANHLFWTGGAAAAIPNETSLFGGPRYGYYAGAMALSILRSGIGDEKFSQILKGWVANYGGKTATTEDFLAFAEPIAGVSLDQWANVWLYGKVKPSSFSFTATGETAPTITGPNSMTLAVGYGATSTSTFTLTGAPAPTVTKTSGNESITWNNSTKRLNIAAGLAEGSYPVVLSASNGVGSAATITFTVRVTATAEALSITGPTSLSLDVEYTGASSSAFTITGMGTLEVTVQCAADTEGKITWNNTTKTIDIAEGLAEGTYVVTVKVSNGSDPDATCTFTLTVGDVGNNAWIWWIVGSIAVVAIAGVAVFLILRRKKA